MGRDHIGQAVNILAAHWGKPVDGPMLETYHRALADVPEAALARAVDRALKTCKFLPVASELRLLAGAEPPDLQAARVWSAIWTAVAKHRAKVRQWHASQPDPRNRCPIPSVLVNGVDFGDPVIHATIRILGGWEAFLERRDTDPLRTFHRQDFLHIYGQFATAQITPEEAAPLEGTKPGLPVKLDLGLPQIGREPSVIGQAGGE
jgi:hypothetical protein